MQTHESDGLRRKNNIWEENAILSLLPKYTQNQNLLRFILEEQRREQNILRSTEKFSNIRSHMLLQKQRMRAKFITFYREIQEHLFSFVVARTTYENKITYVLCSQKNI